MAVVLAWTALSQKRVGQKEYDDALIKWRFPIHEECIVQTPLEVIDAIIPMHPVFPVRPTMRIMLLPCLTLPTLFSCLNPLPHLAPRMNQHIRGD